MMRLGTVIVVLGTGTRRGASLTELLAYIFPTRTRLDGGIWIAEQLRIFAVRYHSVGQVHTGLSDWREQGAANDMGTRGTSEGTHPVASFVLILVLPIFCTRT